MAASTVIPRHALRSYERGSGNVPPELAPTLPKLYAMILRRFICADEGKRYPLLYQAMLGAGYKDVENELKLNQYVQLVFDALPPLPYWDGRKQEVVPNTEALGQLRFFQQNREKWLQEHK